MKKENPHLKLIKALRKLDPDAVLIDSKGRAWTAEDLEYTLLDEVRDPAWNSQPVTVGQDGIFSLNDDGTSGKLIYLFSEPVMSSGGKK